jgi:nucleoside-diphosphate-sugar epimerase
MPKEIILVIGAGGQIGVDLTLALRKYYGGNNVIAADLREENHWLKGTGPFVKLDVMNNFQLHDVIRGNKVTQVYHMAAMLSAMGELRPAHAWELNMQSLLQVLEAAKELKLRKVFWPSSIAVFGNDSPKESCPQKTSINPATVYGISKYAGECWCNYYHAKYGVDVRSLRYPGLISWKSVPGGGTTDYAVDIFHKAITHNEYTCFLKEDTILPMMYMPDAVRATIKLMEAQAEQVVIRNSYNVASLNFSPAELAGAIEQHSPGFTIKYQPDYRQAIADSWPRSVDDSEARNHWNWFPKYDLSRMTFDMLNQLQDSRYALANTY